MGAGASFIEVEELEELTEALEQDFARVVPRTPRGSLDVASCDRGKVRQVVDGAPAPLEEGPQEPRQREDPEVPREAHGLNHSFLFKKRMIYNLFFSLPFFSRHFSDFLSKKSQKMERNGGAVCTPLF